MKREREIKGMKSREYIERLVSAGLESPRYKHIASDIERTLSYV